MIADAEDRPDNSNAWKNVVRIVGSPGDTYVAQADILKMANILPELTTFGGSVDPFDVVVAQTIVVHQDDELQIETLTQRTFEGASIPSRYNFTGRRIAIWFRKESKRRGTLIGSTDLLYVLVDPSPDRGVAPLLAFGPEPQASAVWCFEVDLDNGLESDHLSYLVSKLGVNYDGYLFRALNKAGEPLPGKWFLRLAKKTETSSSISDVDYISQWLKERTKGIVVEGSLWYEEICCVCWQSDLHGRAKAHHGGNCLPLATFNKVCKAVNLTPITITLNSINSSLQKEPIRVETVTKDFDKVHKELKGEIAGLTKRLVAVEKKCNIKRGADVEASSSAPPNKKSKRVKSKERTEGSQEGKPSKPGKPGKPGRPATPTNPANAVASSSGKGKEKA
ncbi:hypothetical protein EDB85DRAFT_1890614 [Lactarius pseudohatsudake]|nr:hypothetical protein EDB85DRAFT_1890614 [Lactarius pseudohatsudake]